MNIEILNYLLSIEKYLPFMSEGEIKNLATGNTIPEARLMVLERAYMAHRESINAKFPLYAKSR